MKHKEKTKDQLINEMEKLHHRIAELEASETKRKRAEEDIKQRSCELAALNAIAAVMSQSLNLDEILNAGLDKVLELMHLDVGGIYLIDPECRQLDLVVHRGISKEFAHEMRSVRVDKKTLEAAMAEGKLKRFIFSVEAVMRDRANLKRIVSAMKKEELSLALAVPVLLQAKEEIVGLMIVISRAPQQLSEAELQLLISICQQIAVAIQNARLYEASQRELADRKQAEEALQKSEKNWSDSFNSLEDIMLIIDKDYNIENINDSGLKILGKSKGEVIGKKCYRLIRNADGAKEFCPLRKSLKTKAVESIEQYEEIFGRHFSIKSSPIFDENGEIVKLVDLMRDITEHKRTEQELIRLSNAVKVSTDSIVITDSDAKIIDVNEATLKMYGTKDKRDLVGKKSFDLIAPEDRKKVFAGIKELMEKGYIKGQEYHIILKDGTKLPVEMNTAIMSYVNGKPIGFVAITRDITERKMAEEKIKIYQGKLRSLASRLSLAEEKERRRIATMLHDNLGQKLALAKVSLGVLRESLSAPELVRSINEIRELIQEAIKDTSSLTFELSPPILYELGLAAAVEWLTEQIQDKYNIQTDFEDDGQPKPLGNDIRVFLFQAVRELLINAVKHSQANKVKVSSRGDGKIIRIRIEDNGIGFEVSEIQPYFAKTGGFGLFNIHERLEQLGGHMEIESKPGRGTQVALVAPLECEEKISKQK